MKKLFFVLVLVILLFSKGATQNRFLIKVTPVTPEETKLLSGSGVKAYAKTADYYLVEATLENLEYLNRFGITYKVLDEKPEFSLYYFIWTKPGEKITKYMDQIEEKAVIIETEGERAIIKGHPFKIEELTSFDLKLKHIKKRALPIKSEGELPLLIKSKVPTYDPLIVEIIQKVNSSNLTDYVADLSGENPVEIGGAIETLFTRFTYSGGCDKAALYLKEKFESFGLSAWLDTTTTTMSPIYPMDIKATPDGDTAWIGSIDSGIWKTINAGVNWYHIAGTENYTIWELSYPSPGTLYAVGNEGTIIKSVNGGEVWFELSSPSSVDFRGIYFESSQVGWVTGYSGKILFTTDGGQNWTTQNSTTTKNLYEITFVDSNSGWVVGGFGTILHTTDRGNSWSPQNSGTFNTIVSLDFATPNIGWVCGFGDDVRYTSNSGVNWVRQTYEADDFYTVFAIDSLNVWAGGGYMLFHTTDGGGTWDSVSSNPNVGYFYDIYFVDSLKGWVGGYTDLLITTDGGQNWIQQIENFSTYPLKNVVAVLPGLTEPGKECLLTAHYDAISEDEYIATPGADDNASGVAAVLAAADILKDYQFEYSLKFVCFSGEEVGILGSEGYAEEAYQRGDTIIGVYNLDMIAWDGNDDNIIELHAGTGAISGALADIMIEVINNYDLTLVPEKITSGATNRSDHASFWEYGFPAILGVEDFNDFNPHYHTTNDLLVHFDLPYYNAFAKAGIASAAILADIIHPYIFGDADGSGEVNVSDGIYLINYLFKGGPAPDPYPTGDVDCSGEINVSDVIYLINYLFKGGPEPCQ